MGYAAELAFAHEAGFTFLAEAAARELAGRLSPKAHVFDVGCGGGTLLDLLAAQGHTGQGVDLSPDMVALARKRLPHAVVEVEAWQDVDVPPCDAVTAIGEVLAYEFVPGDDATLAAFFDRAFAALRPGGTLLFDVPTIERPDETTRSSKEGRSWRVQAEACIRDGHLVRIIDTWRTPRPGAPETHLHEEHVLRLFDPLRLEQMLRHAGFEVERMAGYDDHGFQPGWDAFAATKPSGQDAGPGGLLDVG